MLDWDVLANPLKELSFKALFDAAADAMLLVDNTGHVIEANHSALQLFEYSEDVICGLAVEALIPARFRTHHHEYRDAFFKTPAKRSMGNGRDLFALSKSGKELAVDIGLSPIHYDQHNYILISFYAADKRRETEQALRTSKERLQLAKQAAHLGVFDYDIKLKVIHWDERMRELWGGESNQYTTYEKFMAAIHPDDCAARQAAVDAASDPTGDGKYKLECRVINTNDGIERWVASAGLMHFKDGQAIRLVGVAQEITEHKNLEKTFQEQRLEGESLFKQQVAARTASAIAHELNQPLAAISAYSEVALHALNNTTSNPDKLKRALEGCVAQAQRAGTSLHELLAFLQEGELLTERFDLNHSVNEALSITKADGYKEFQPILQLDINMPAVMANRIQIQKVLVNLLRNAVEAMRGLGVNNKEITVTVRTHKDMKMAHATVKDSGPGINQDTLKRVFEPFFTTKPTGIGMGLAISRALIEANGGQLWVEPSNKSGAIFHFTLPFSPEGFET